MAEAAEFVPRYQESLHTALDEGEVRLARSTGIARYPARFQLVMGSPPCACGPTEPGCTCSPSVRRRFTARLTGPLLDRTDLRVRLRPPPSADAADVPTPESTAVVRQRVQHARHRAARRWAEHGAHTNADIPVSTLRRRSLPDGVLALLDASLATGSLTRRGADGVLRVAWTLSDLAGLDRPGADQIAQALMLRDRRSA